VDQLQAQAVHAPEEDLRILAYYTDVRALSVAARPSLPGCPDLQDTSNIADTEQDALISANRIAQVASSVVVLNECDFLGAACAALRYHILHGLQHQDL
jgi:hypothetical protein